MRKSVFLVLTLISKLVQSSLFGLFSNPAITQDVVWLQLNSSSIAHTNTDIPAIVYDENVRPASNLTQPSRNGLRGILYGRNQSCTQESPSPPFFNDEYNRALPRIALIKGGGPCPLADKIRLAQQDGALGTIVYEDSSISGMASDYDADGNMRIPADSGITIPAFHVDPRIGSQLNYRISFLAQSASSEQQQAVRVHMLPGNSRGPNPWELTLIIMIVLLGIGFLTSVAMHCHLLRKNRRLREQVEQGLIPPPPEMLPMGKQLLSLSQLASLPTRTVTDNRRMSVITIPVDDTCVICLDKIKSGDTVRQLPCNHEYHCTCIDPWLTAKSAECPLCKFDCAARLAEMQEAPGTATAAALPSESSRMSRLKRLWARVRPTTRSSENRQETIEMPSRQATPANQ